MYILVIVNRLMMRTHFTTKHRSISSMGGINSFFRLLFCGIAIRYKYVRFSTFRWASNLFSSTKLMLFIRTATFWYFRLSFKAAII